MYHVCVILKWFYNNYYNKDNTLILKMTAFNGWIVPRIIKNDEQIEAYRFKTVKKRYIPYRNWIEDRLITKEELSKWILDENMEKELENILEEKKKEYKELNEKRN